MDKDILCIWLDAKGSNMHAWRAYYEESKKRNRQPASFHQIRIACGQEETRDHRFTERVDAEWHTYAFMTLVAAGARDIFWCKELGDSKVNDLLEYVAIPQIQDRLHRMGIRLLVINTTCGTDRRMVTV
jgi:hypothetical protein